MGPKECKIGELDLDLENPRIVGAKNQREALQKIIEDQKDKLYVLAKSIIEDEGLNPMDRFLVVKDPRNGLFVLEGNRRLAALKILATPSILDDLPVPSSLRKNLERLAKQFDRSAVEPLPCFEVKDRDAGLKWLPMRHTGQNSGKGIVEWSALAKLRFAGQAPALQALAFVSDHGKLTPEQKASVAPDSDFPITTLDRLLSSTVVRDRLGFDVKNRKLVSALPPDELMKPLRRLILDLAAGTLKVSEVLRKEQQVLYFDKTFDKKSLPNLSKTGATRPIEAIVESDFTKAPVAPVGQPAKKRKRSRSSSERRTIIPKNADLEIKHRRINLIFDELQRVKVEDAPNALAVLFRVFLELSVDHFMEQNQIPLTEKDKGGHVRDKTLKSKVAEVVEHFVAQGMNRKDFKSVLRAIHTANSPLSVELLNDYVHNRFTTPKVADLLSSWDDAERFFGGLWP